MHNRHGRPLGYRRSGRRRRPVSEQLDCGRTRRRRWGWCRGRGHDRESRRHPHGRSRCRHGRWTRGGHHRIGARRPAKIKEHAENAQR